MSLLLGCGASRSTDDEASGGTGGGGPVVPNPFPCEDPTPVVEARTGFVECSNGYTYRSEPGRCPIVRRTEPVEGGGPDAECRYDADCSADPQGYCRTGFCEHACVTDAECSPGSICVCGLDGLGLGNCVSAQCSSDRDCEPGLHCALIVTGVSDSAFWVYACQKPTDTCVADDDCPPLEPAGAGNCELGDDGRYCRATP